MWFCRYQLAKHVYPKEGDYMNLDSDGVVARILHRDVQRTKNRLKSVQKLVLLCIHEISKTKRQKLLRKLSNILPVYLKPMLFERKNSGLISSMRRMIARFEQSPILFRPCISCIQIWVMVN
jgi:hypothetical protein